MSSRWLTHRRIVCGAATLAASVALIPALAQPVQAAPAAKSSAAAAGTASPRPLSSLPRAQRKEIQRLIASRRARSGKPRARAAFTDRLWYDYYAGTYRVATAASAQYLQGYTYINVWNPMVKTINGLSSQRVAFRALVYNPKTGDSAVSDWWKGTTQNWGSYSGPSFVGGYVYNHRTGERNNGDGAITLRGVDSGWWAYMWVEWHTSSGYLQRQVGFWLQ
jgi:hypothetical protein